MALVIRYLRQSVSDDVYGARVCNHVALPGQMEPYWPTANSCMCQALRVRRCADHTHKIGNTQCRINH